MNLKYSLLFTNLHFFLPTLLRNVSVYDIVSIVQRLLEQSEIIPKLKLKFDLNKNN